MQTACILILIYDHNIWQTFAHYLRHPTPAGDLKKHTAAERGQFFDTMLQKLCMELGGIPEYTREKKKPRATSSAPRRRSKKSKRTRRRGRGAVGFAAGATTGALVGGPVGAVLGGVIGGITGRHSRR